MSGSSSSLGFDSLSVVSVCTSCLIGVWTGECSRETPTLRFLPLDGVLAVLGVDTGEVCGDLDGMDKLSGVTVGFFLVVIGVVGTLTETKSPTDSCCDFLCSLILSTLSASVSGCSLTLVDLIFIGILPLEKRLKVGGVPDPRSVPEELSNEPLASIGGARFGSVLARCDDRGLDDDGDFVGEVFRVGVGDNPTLLGDIFLEETGLAWVVAFLAGVELLLLLLRGLATDGLFSFLVARGLLDGEAVPVDFLTGEGEDGFKIDFLGVVATGLF